MCDRADERKKNEPSETFFPSRSLSTLEFEFDPTDRSFDKEPLLLHSCPVLIESMHPRRQNGAPASASGRSGATAVRPGASGGGANDGANTVADRPRPPLGPPPPPTPPPPPPSLALDTAALAAGLALVSIMFSVFAPEAYMVRSFLGWYKNRRREKRKAFVTPLRPTHLHLLLPPLHLQKKITRKTGRDLPRQPDPSLLRGAVAEWDPKITTPPGLYVLAVGWARALRAAAALRRRLSAFLFLFFLPVLSTLLFLSRLSRTSAPIPACARSTFSCPSPASSPRRLSTEGSTSSPGRRRRRRAPGGGGATTETCRRRGERAARCAGLPAHARRRRPRPLLPTHAFYSFLFYTDVGALAAILAPGPSLCGGATGRLRPFSLVALSFRQTSAVWCCFILGDAALRELTLFQRQSEGEGGGLGEQGGGSPSPPPPPTILREAAAVAAALLENRARVLRRVLSGCFPLLIPLLASAAFVRWNGGSLALGDRDNHAVSAHWAQALYASCFAFLALFPALGRGADVVAALVEISPVRAVAVGEAEEGGARASSSRRGGRGGGGGKSVALRPNVRGLRSFLSLFCFAWLAAAHGTIEHPFLLSDNRHFSFYAWRLARRLLGPVGSAGRTAATALAGAAAFAWLRRLLTGAPSPLGDERVPPSVVPGVRAGRGALARAVAAARVPVLHPDRGGRGARGGVARREGGPRGRRRPPLALFSCSRAAAFSGAARACSSPLRRSPRRRCARLPDAAL